MLALAALASGAHAATKVWVGPGTDLATAANWSDGTLPAVNDTLQWNGTVAGPLALTLTNSTAFVGNNGYFIEVTSAQTSPLQIDNVTTNVAGNGIRLANITIASGAGAFTLGDGIGTAVISLGSSALTSNTFTNNSANAATIASDVVWANGNAVTGRVLTFTGTGNWNMNSVFGVTVTSGSGTFALSKQGTGTLTLTATNTYTAGTTIGANSAAGGVTRVDANGALGTGTVTISGNTGANERLEIVNGRTLANAFTLNGRQGATAR
jgi:autotransporter-associated beta strand protein